MTGQSRCCDLCGADIVAGKRWVLLNRYGVGSGSSCVLTEGRNGNDDYEWDRGEEWLASGPLLCFPGCLSQWVEAKMAEGDAMKRMGRAE